MTNDQKCEDVIPARLASRLESIRTLQRLADAYDDDTARAALAAPGGMDWLAETGEDWNAGDHDAISDAARETLQGYPLAVSSRVVFHIDLSTGGPGDWLEVFCDVERHEHWTEYTAERITYHYADWFDHASRELDGPDFDTAETFARSVVPEMVQ